jgi:predicted ATPase
MCLATLLLQPEPPLLVLIDEPELGLHPFAIVQLADLIRSVTQDRRDDGFKRQVIV